MGTLINRNDLVRRLEAVHFELEYSCQSLSAAHRFTAIEVDRIRFAAVAVVCREKFEYCVVNGLAGS
jgi:hypothetical protein